MKTKEAVAHRIQQLCAQKDISINALADRSGVPPMTVYSIMGVKSQNPGIVTIKKLCDGLDISLTEFFTTPEFEQLEQEIQ